MHRHETRTRAVRQGFTLVELMMVIAILAIVTTMALPGIQQARKRANEASAIADLRIFTTAQGQYRVRYGTFGTVASLEAAGILDENFQDQAKSGYRYEDATAPTRDAWAVRANPEVPGQTGDRHFYIDTDGVIYYRDGAIADASAPPIE